MKTTLVLLSFLLIASVSIFGQNSLLTVTGTVTEVTVSPQLVPVLIDKNNEWGEFRWERSGGQEPWFSVSVRLQFCNKDTVAVIVPKYRGSIKLLFLEMPAQDSPVSATPNLHKYVSTRPVVDPLPAFMKEFDKPEPSRSAFALIEPGTCFDTTELIPLASGYKIRTLPSAEKRQRPYDIAVPEHPQFKIQYSLSIKDSLPVSDAKRRWSPIGKLLTTSDGDFFFETDVIMNKLPE